LPAPGGPVSPIRRARPVRAWREPSISSNPSRWFSTMLTTRASAADFPALKSSIRRLEDARKNPLLSAPHGRRCTSRARWMIVAENVKCSVNYKTQQLLSGRNALCLSVFPRDLGADVDVSHYGATSPDTAKPKRNYVGRTVVPEVAMVQLRHCGSPNERNR
jgi:hypothetical protein